MKIPSYILDLLTIAAVVAMLWVTGHCVYGSPIPFNSRPGAPVTLYVTTGLPAEAWFPGISVPTLPPPAFSDSDLEQIYQYIANALANENITVRNVDPVTTLDAMGWTNSPGAVQAERIVLTSSDLAFYPQWTSSTGGFNTTFGYYDPGTILHKPFGDPTGTLLPWDSHTGFVSDRFGLIFAEKDVLHEFLVGMGVAETPGVPSDIMSPILFPDNTVQTISASDLAQLNSHVDEGGPQTIPEPEAIGFMALVAAWIIGQRRATNKLTR